MKWSTFMGIGILGGIVLYLLFGNAPGRVPTAILQPADSSFAPVTVHQVKPDLLGRYDHPSGVRLPKGLKESEIEKIIVLERAPARSRDDSSGRALAGEERAEARSNIPIIIDRQGHVYADTALVGSVDLYEYSPPFLAFDPAVGLGMGYTSHGPEPDVSVSLIRIGRVRLPAIAIGTRTAGIGAQLRLYKNLHAGLFVAARYHDLSRRLIKANITINL